MKKSGQTIKKIFYAVIAVFSFASCENMMAAKEGLNIRVSAVSENNGDIVFKVCPENYLGQIVNGALIYVQNSEGQTSQLDFNNSLQCYMGNFAGLRNDVYKVYVSSALLDEAKFIEIPHTVLTQKPVVRVFSDSSGNSVMNGEAVNPNNEIQLGWSSADKDALYNIVIKTSLATVYSASVNGCTVSIPGGTLKNGSYYLYIYAQKAYGDMLYNSQPYYSVSKISSTPVRFNVE